MIFKIHIAISALHDGWIDEKYIEDLKIAKWYTWDFKHDDNIKKKKE